jgi:hypothetical protein
MMLPRTCSRSFGPTSASEFFDAEADQSQKVKVRIPPQRKSSRGTDNTNAISRNVELDRDCAYDSACMSTEEKNQHISTERMRQFITDRSATLTVEEQDHVLSCDSCLHEYGDLLLSGKE